MPTPWLSGLEMPFVGEDVIWHAQGKRVGKGNIAKVIATNPQRGYITLYKYEPTIGRTKAIIKDVPYIMDPQLQNPEFARRIGCWEHAPVWTEFRMMNERLAELERRAGPVKV